MLHNCGSRLCDHRLRFRVARLPRLVHLLAGQAEIRDGGFNVPLRNVEVPSATVPCHRAPLLRGVILIRKAALGPRVNFQGIGLVAVRGRYQLVVRAFGLGEA